MLFSIPKTLYKRCISALENTDYQVIMSVGNLVSIEEFGMLPQTAEQAGVAERVCQLGAGIKLDKSDVSSILDAINKLLEDSTYKQNAQKLADGFKRCSGAKGAADKILQVCESTIKYQNC